MADADIIVIGSGHNGLVAAAYLAVAGRKVLVLERNEWFGGGVVTRELTRPGFRHDQHSMSHIFIQGNPLLLHDELGLKRKYGLRYVFPEVPMMSVWEDGSTLPLPARVSRSTTNRGSTRGPRPTTRRRSPRSWPRWTLWTGRSARSSSCSPWRARRSPARPISAS